MAGKVVLAGSARTGGSDPRVAASADRFCGSLPSSGRLENDEGVGQQEPPRLHRQPSAVASSFSSSTGAVEIQQGIDEREALLIALY
jgi:hypothetical protein